MEEKGGELGVLIYGKMIYLAIFKMNGMNCVAGRIIRLR